ncbi:TPA: anticodon nuclease, partial [Haemophilus influenzae]
MTKSLDEIAKQLRDSNKKVNLIYAFNGSGKTRLSKVFKNLIVPKENHGNEEELTRRKVLYFNAFTEDLFYWDNDLLNDTEPKLKIQPNSFIRWLIKDQGDEDKIIGKFHHYCDEKLMPKFDIENNQITFSFARGNDTFEENIKLSKGEESNFIWSIFHTLIEQVVAELNISEPSERTTNEFDELKYIFIDDPVSSLDENHLIQLAVDLAELVKDSPNTIKFIITTHNPLFHNVLYNELGAKSGYILRKDENKNENERFDLEEKQGGSNKSFSYHLFLRNLLEEVESKDIQKYHFMLLRNLYEKTANFLGYSGWS